MLADMQSHHRGGVGAVGWVTGYLRRLFTPAVGAAAVRWALAAILVGAAFRVGVFVFAAYQPFIDESGRSVSPVMIQEGADYSFYRDSHRLYSLGFDDLIDVVKNSLDVERIKRELEGGYGKLYRFVLSGPVMPWLFDLFNYETGNTLPLSLFSLLVGILTNIIWILFFLKIGRSSIWLVVFALLPNAVWYQLNNSADHFLFLFFTLFFVTYYSNLEYKTRLGLSVFFVLMMCLTKPNALPVLGFLFLDFLRERWHQPWNAKMKLFVGLVVALCFVGAVFYAGYFAAVMRSTMVYKFFGIAYVDYFSGIYNSLPDVLNKPLSWISLLGAKLLYFFGLRPSWGSTSDAMVLVRAAPGLILLPGLIWLLLKGNRSMALLVVLFIVPPFMGPAQERYNLPIHPILFLYGTLAYAAIAAACWRRGSDSVSSTRSPG